MNNGLSIATYIWQLGMMYIISKQRITLCAQVEGMRGEIFAASPIALQSRIINKERIEFCAQVEGMRGHQQNVF
jgi:hypothetical protein